MKRLAPSLVVILGGVSAALHVGKLPPALPVLREVLGISLMQAGFLLSMVQLAGMTLGLAVGLAADAIGLKRTMTGGLLILSLASLAGGWVHDPSGLLALRAIEGLGVLLACMPAPGLIRRLVAPQRLQVELGLWSAYMPLGTALALLLGPAVIAQTGWPGWWWLMGCLSLAMCLWLHATVPADPAQAGFAASQGPGWKSRLWRTLSTRGHWLISSSFAAYSAQWLAVIGFLPSIYAQAGIVGALAACATALAAAVNIVGNVAAGRLLQRGIPAPKLLLVGFAAMGVGASVAFSLISPAAGWGAGLAQYAAVLVFSMTGGMIPATLFSLAVRLAPGEDAVSTTVGWMQQWSSLGQFAGPPLVALVATHAGGWQWSWTVTGTCALAGLGLAWAIGRELSVARPRT
jgi:CP family cyanate transporter-like MFS transporter